LNKKLSFAINDIRLEEEIDKSQFAVLSVDAFATGKSAHETIVSEETLRRTANTILLKPFVFAIDKRFDDLAAHEKDEVPGGFVPHNSPIEFKTLEDGRIMMTCRVLVWKRYSGKLLEYFSRDGNRKSVSVEIEVVEAQEDPSTGLLEIKDFIYNAITALGDLIRPAIPNAEAVLQFSQEFEQAKQEYELEFGKYEDIDFTIPKKIKRAAKKALDEYEENGGVVSPTYLAMARFLVREEKITPEKLRQMSKFFNRKNLSEDDISFGMFGGKESSKWCKMMVEYLDDVDSKKVSYFESNESSLNEDDLGKKEDKNFMAKKKEETKVEEPEKEEVEMATPEEEKPEPVEEPKEEMAAPEQEDEKKPEEEMAAPADEEKPEPKSEEMAAEEPEKKEDEEPEEEFSFGFSVDEAMAMMPEDDEKCSMARGEFAKGKDADGKVMMAGMFAAMQKMAAKCHAAEEEMSALKEFKAGIEAQQKQFAVDMTLKELSEKFAIPEETLAEMRSDAEKIEFEGLESWKTSVKAKSVDFAVIGKKDKEDVVRIGLVWNTAPRKAQDNLWVK
jgi:hypothetical protein